MKKYVILEKEVGETPLSVLEKFRDANDWVGDKPLAYAGRLDPMASGQLLILIGNECKRQDAYLGLDKEYTFEVLLGFSSDTGDVLGMASADAHLTKVSDDTLRQTAQTFLGKQSFSFPHYSSKTVHGKPLHVWTLEGRLDEIEIPTKESTVYRLDYLGSRTLSKHEVQKQISNKIESIPKVTASSKALGRDFRRVDIRARWQELFAEIEEGATFQIAQFRCVASSGTYMRTLATEIGKKVGIHGLAFSIHRTRIGRYKKINRLLGFWWKVFK